MERTDDADRLMSAIQALVRRFSLVERADTACCGMTVAQAATLEALGREGSVPLAVLRRRLGITASTLTRNLDRLRARELVETSTDPRDRRASLVSLTPAGRAAAGEVSRQERAFAESVVAALGETSSSEVVASLERLLRAIRVASRDCCPGAFDHLMDSTIWTGGDSDDQDDTTERPCPCG